jgi:hypothetical protein
MARFRPAEFVRTISRGERVADIVDEAKYRAWRDEAEHLVLKLSTGERLMVKGGRDGVNFVRRVQAGSETLHMRFSGRLVRVVRIFGHTHPRVTGPSDGDLRALAILGQKRSYIFEIGGDSHGTLIRPKNGPGGD